MLEEGYEKVEEMMTIIHEGNYQRKISILDKIEILKAASLQNYIIYIMNGKNDLLYKILVIVDSFPNR